MRAVGIIEYKVQLVCLIVLFLPIRLIKMQLIVSESWIFNDYYYKYIYIS